MIEHKISGSLSHWTVEDPKSKKERWRGYIISKLSYPDAEREKFPFLVYDSYKGGENDWWCRTIYLNDNAEWQGKFCLLTDENRAKELMGSLVKPTFKDFVSLLAPLVPADFTMPKKRKSKKDVDED